LLDGVEIGEASRDVPIPVDAGAHELRASAPERVALVKVVRVAEGPGTTAVSLEPLAKAVAREPPARGRSAALLAIGGVGAVGLASMTYFGLRAFAAVDHKPRACSADDDTCLARARSLEDERGTDTTVATIGGGVALAAAATCVVLLVLPRSSHAPPATTAWSVSPLGRSGASLGVRF
jgi:hypothetical protein